MAELKDYYKVLAVERDVDERALKSAYRRLALKYHPDTARSRRAAQRFVEIREAYEVLSDPKKRRAYDDALRAQALPVPAGPSDGERATRPRRTPFLGIDIEALGFRLSARLEFGPSGLTRGRSGTLD